MAEAYRSLTPDEQKKIYVEIYMGGEPVFAAWWSQDVAVMLRGDAYAAMCAAVQDLIEQECE